MKAVVWTRYGPPEVLEYREIDKPTPKDNEVLVRVRAATVTAGDCELRRLQLPMGFSLPFRLYVGFSKPKRVTILGQEFAGEVEEAGKGVTEFKPGDAIFGITGLRFGAYAEYACIDAEAEDAALALKPQNLAYEQAACAPTGGLEAIHFLGLAKVQRGERVLILGAGGSIGTVGVQLAKYYGAHVTAVDRTGKLEMLRGIGADEVIDFTREDFTKRGEQYDVIFDAVGKSSLTQNARTLAPKGRYLLTNPRFATLLQGMWLGWTSDKKVISQFAARKPDEMRLLEELLTNGDLKPVIDRTYALQETVEAHRYVESGEKKGCVVIRV